MPNRLSPKMRSTHGVMTNPVSIVAAMKASDETQLPMAARLRLIGRIPR